jgi:hypothetical protein
MQQQPAADRPALSVVVPTRDGLGEVAVPLQALLPEAEARRVEVVVVGRLGPEERAPSECVRLVPVDSGDMLELHRRGVEAATGAVVAIGEDHAVPRPGWCEAVVRAHAERPEAGAVAGCLVNATAATVAGRANFLAFAAAWQPPMSELPSHRPPPASTLSFKREALEGIEARPVGWLEAETIPSLFLRGEMVADDRIVVDHHQDHGSLWSVTNAFHSARASYGAKRAQLTSRERYRKARWAIANVPRQLRAEARMGTAGTGLGLAERTLVGVISLSAGLGGAAGALLGPGRSGDLVA